MNQVELLSSRWATTGATGQRATRENKLLAPLGVKRTFDEPGNEHLEPLGNEHTLACNTDNKPRSGGDTGIKSIVKHVVKPIVKHRKGAKPHNARSCPSQCPKECTVCIRKDSEEGKLDCLCCSVETVDKGNHSDKHLLMHPSNVEKHQRLCFMRSTGCKACSCELCVGHVPEERKQ